MLRALREVVCVVHPPSDGPLSRMNVDLDVDLVPFVDLDGNVNVDSTVDLDAGA